VNLPTNLHLTAHPRGRRRAGPGRNPVPLSQSAQARPVSAGTASSMAAKPTIVLEHGAWADASSWDAVIARLQHDGYTVYAPPNPLQSLPYDSATLSDFLSTIKGPIVLVGRSYGGMVITNAARGHSNVRALVYDDAFIPAQGQTAFGSSGPSLAPASGATPPIS
jgi:pimeloyl-ACP methyl ester carboxylesterase